MLTIEQTEQALQEFLDYVVRESKKKAPKASGDLKKSIRSGGVKVTSNSLTGVILAEDYLPFIDKGVSGTQKRYNTPFRYKSKGGKNGLKGMPPPNKLTTYMKRKSGKFLARDRKDIGFATAVSIFKYGIKPTRFFTTPFENAFKQLPEEIVEAFALDIEDFMELVLNNE